jgi:NADH-quinone oxidoreductase subunit C
MIREKTKLALQKLFPAPEAKEIALEDAGEEQVKKAPKKPRQNGLIERDYAVHGYHLDAQVAAQYFIESITGVDWIKEDQFEVIYDFARYDFDLCRVVIRTRVARTEPVVPTITGIYAGANWHERETHDFFGIKFSGHPHLIPLLLPEDADFHPLKKDFKA